ncbi:hypothetical protein AQUCO_02600034v1 [Aquilegia coerulea]|uniref:Serine aminopeptidase S33 domain-containing protein n=1 Tax=Aquilegia coerulea TaxID=218851 RepID=A0A2G5D711_AQUCA|nr:hypothetical protein AQUCO_02600034v1 [Aquilegia coerulea]
MEQLVSFIIRPPRAEYNPKDDLLDQEFMLKGQWFQRKDLEVINSRGDVLQCSHYTPLVIPEGTKLPCVIYCHGNSGCRADASEAAIILLPSYITVFTLDFSGSGLSGGEHVSLGWHEDDLKAVVDFLRSGGNVSCIGLWGRSMGAVTSLMYGAEDPSIAGMVLDSPFSDLVELMMELVDTYKFRLPKFTVKFAIQYMRKTIQKKAKFDITDLNTIKVAKSCFVPVLIGHAIDDDFIHPHHSERIYDAYVGDKNIIKFEGDHNSPRPQFYFDSITIFFHNVLHPPKMPIDGNSFDSMQNYFEKGSWDTMHEVGYSNYGYVDASTGLGTSTTEEAINEHRSKWNMSRMPVPSDNPSKAAVSRNEQENGHDPLSSSSGLISFELSNGHPYVPVVPSTIDDDQYVEYPLDNPSGFPCNMEEEERMFMEAVVESLKDLEVRHPHEEDQLSTMVNGSLKVPDKDNGDSLSKEHERPSRSDGSSTSGTYNSHDTACEQPSPHVSVSSSEPTFDTAPSVFESGSVGTSPPSETSLKTQSSSSDGYKSAQDTDTGGTRATLTVQKNPATNIMDGLRHRWGLNFFKNS